jgi:DNA-binding transcriptional ArsR family regulator
MAKLNLDAFHDAAATLKNVADGTRLAIVALLLDGPRNVTEICEHVNMAQPAVSHHLSLMRHTFLTARRDGKNVIYSIRDPKPARAVIALAFPNGLPNAAPVKKTPAPKATAKPKKKPAPVPVPVDA